MSMNHMYVKFEITTLKFNFCPPASTLVDLNKKSIIKKQLKSASEEAEMLKINLKF